MFDFLRKKAEIPPPPSVKSSSAQVDSQVYHLFQWDGFGFVLKPYKGDLVATQIFYPKIKIDLETDSIVMNASAEVLTVGENLAAKWVEMNGAEARWLKRYLLRHGPGHNPNVVDPTTAEPEPPPAEAAAGEKSGTAVSPKQGRQPKK
jgi:hypothetical protein